MVDWKYFKFDCGKYYDKYGMISIWSEIIYVCDFKFVSYK